MVCKVLNPPKKRMALIQLQICIHAKAVNRGDKRTRRVRDRDFVKFERSRRYRDRYRCQSRRGRALGPVFRDPPRRERELDRWSRFETPPPSPPMV